MLSAVVALLAPIQGLIVCVTIFIAIDFATGVAASYKRAKRADVQWWFSSEQAWNSIMKLAFVMAGIVLAWLIDRCILDFMSLNLAKLFTGFVCGIEFWSYLENASEISNHPIFNSLRTFLKKKVDTKLNMTDEEDIQSGKEL